MSESAETNQATAPERAALGDVSGYRSTTEDSLTDLEIEEGRINPHSRSKGQAGAGAPAGMMPPVMGAGGMGRGGAGMSTAGGAMGRMGPSTAPGGLGNTGAMGSGSGVGGSGAGAPGGGVGAGGAFGSFSPGGLESGAATIAAGSSGKGYGFGINPATGKPWSPSDPGFAEKFGTYDPTTGKYVNPTTGQIYDPITGKWTTPTVPGSGSSGGSAGGISTGYGHYDPRTGKWIGPDGASYDYNPGSGRYYDPATGKWRDVNTGRYYDNPTGPDTDPFPADGRPLVPAPEIKEPQPGGIPTPSPSTLGPSEPGGFPTPKGPGNVPGISGDPPTGSKDVEVDLKELELTARHWQELSGRMEKIKSNIDGLKDAVKFAKVSEPQAGYVTAQETAVSYTGTSSAKMGQTSTRTANSARNYQDTDAASAQEVRSTVSLESDGKTSSGKQSTGNQEGR